MRRRLAAALVGVLLAWPAAAADRALLIQRQADGGFAVWHNEGETRLSDDELAILEENAEPAGGKPLLTALGAVQSFQKDGYVLVSVPQAAKDKALLIDRDACGGVRLWHLAGGREASGLSEAQLIDLVAAAVPGGGERVRLGDRYAKAFLTKLGVVAVIWAPPPPR